MEHPEDLEKQAIQHDRWDRRTFEQVLQEIRDFEVDHNRFHEHVENGPELWADTFWSLWKANPQLNDPEEMRPSHIIDHTVMDQAMDLEEFDRLSYFSRGDHVAAAQACITMRPELEEIWDKLKHHQDLAEELEKLMQELANLMAQQMQGMGGGGEGDEDGQGGGSGEQGEDGEPQEDEGEGEGEGGGEGEGDPQEGEGEGNLQEQIDQVKKMIERLKAQMKDEAANQSPGIRAGMQKAMQKATEEAESLASLASFGWGTEDGSLQRMDVKKRLELAKRLNTPMFKKIAELIGPMRRLMMSAQKRKVNHAEEEIVDITLGNELGKVVPSEFARLQHPYARLLFMKDFFGERLQQYELQGIENVGKGEIIVEIDNSGSMSGDNEAWAKGVGGAFLHLARQQKRGFFGVHFSSRNQIKTYDFGKETDFELERILAFMGDFFGGGTDFEAPLNVALKRIQEQHAKTGEVKADVVFITDGICSVGDEWLKNFKAEQERLDFRVWGVLIGGYAGRNDSEPLNTICDGRVISINDILSGGDLYKMWQGI